MLCTATIILPAPLFIVIFFASSIGLDPLLVSVISGFGQAIGEFSGYGIGYGAQKILRKKYGKWFKLSEKWFKRNGFITILIFAATPLPDDIVGIIGGTTRYGIHKFFLATLIGKIILSLIISYFGRFIVSHFGLLSLM